LKATPTSLEAATFVHTQAGVGVTFALIPADPWNPLNDAATRFAALSDLPGDVARAAIQVLNRPERRTMEEHPLRRCSRSTRPTTWTLLSCSCERSV